MEEASVTWGAFIARVAKDERDATISAVEPGIVADLTCTRPLNALPLGGPAELIWQPKFH